MEKYITTEGEELIDNFCQAYKLNGQIRRGITSMAQSIINNIKYFKIKSNNKIDHVKDAVCYYYNVSPENIYVKEKKRWQSDIRQITQYLAREYTNLSFQKIAEETGKEDHATAYHSYKKIKELITNPLCLEHRKLAEDINEINKRL